MSENHNRYSCSSDGHLS